MFTHSPDEAISTLHLLAKSEDKISHFSVNVMLGKNEVQVAPLGDSAHTAEDAIAAIMAVANMGQITKIYFRVFDI